MAKKNFLAVFTGTAASMKKWEKLPEKTRQEREAAGMQAWHAWVKKNQKAFVFMGSPLGATKQISKKGVKNIRNELCAFTVVQATSHAAAAKLFKDHPHFTLFPGDAIEVMECLEIPGM